ncbi:MAG: hypothetical protein JWP17_4024 [Solirubrobacterales bacterium]|jgi:uncharacterized protein|nr:hypothetical protein [Solirubrobacterales bacterium]
MSQPSDKLDLAALKLTAGEGRRLEHLTVPFDDLDLGGQRYTTPETIDATLDVSRMTGDGYALRLRFASTISGPCMRCLTDAAPETSVDSREVHDEGKGTIEDSELTSPYIEDQVLDLTSWARDALALAMPSQVLCRPDCAGLCAVCGAELNEAGPDHSHEPPRDPRWDALRELKLD